MSLRLVGLVLAAFLYSGPVHAQSAPAGLSELDSVALIVGGFLDGEHRFGDVVSVMTRTGDGVFRVTSNPPATDNEYRQITVTKRGDCKYALVSELKTASGATYSRQLTIADLDAITDLTYSEIRDLPHAYRIGGTNISLANYVGDLLALAVLPAEEMEAFAADYLDTVC